MGQVPEMRSINGKQCTQDADESSTRSERPAQVKVWIRPDLAAAFKATCAANGVTMAGVISGFMEAYSAANAPKKGYLPNLSTKRQRRAAVRRILDQLVRIRDNEENYVTNIPANLQSSEVFLFAEYCVSLLEEAIEALETAYMEKA